MLAHAYAEPPFRIGRTFELDGAAYVILVTSGPGVFGGDALRQSIHVGPGTRVVLTSQSALQVHPASPLAPPVPPARISHEYVVDDGAELHCQWDPVIPFADARLEQRFDLQIAESSQLFWADAVMAGRISRGERWRFATLAHELRLRIGPTLAYLERYTLTPHERAVDRPWVCGGAEHLATTLVHHDEAGPDTAEALHREMAALAGAACAVDFLASRLVLARFLCRNGEPFRHIRASYRAAALRSIFGAAERTGRK